MLLVIQKYTKRICSSSALDILIFIYGNWTKRYLTTKTCNFRLQVCIQDILPSGCDNSSLDLVINCRICHNINGQLKLQKYVNCYHYSKRLNIYSAAALNFDFQQTYFKSKFTEKAEWGFAIWRNGDVDYQLQWT